MRFLLALLTLLALTVAPLASPVEAAQRMAGMHCADGSGQMEHQPSKSPMPADGKCCVAVPAALPPAGSVLIQSAAPDLSTAAAIVPQLAGLSAEAEDPPPRS
ncbi:MAG TPA: hypothetical protein VM913_01530 [Sphingomicrobium sp.]|jgi:hypothetical protein|nr:hypothetical protein [Sphingomicrobium sp.]